MSKPVFEECFSIRGGRRNRLSYLLISLAQIAVGIAFVLMLAALEAAGSSDGLSLMGLVFAVLILPLWWCHFSVAAQRFRDFNQSGWMALLLFIPLVGMIAVLCLYLIPGTDGANRYGEDPIAGPMRYGSAFKT